MVGWASFVHGEATSGDVESLRTVSEWLSEAQLPHDVALSPVLCTDESVLLDDVTPQHYSCLVFACGPLSGWQLHAMHDRFAGCRRIAIGVSVPAPDDPAVTGFHVVIGRDGPQLPPALDLAGLVAPPPPAAAVPLIGVCLANSQPEYAHHQQHERVHQLLTSWLGRLDVMRVPVDTRLDPRDWRLATDPAQLDALLRRCDAIVSTRLHGMVLGLRLGVPVLAVDPVAGGAKVSAQAAAWHWPAVIRAEELETKPDELSALLDWCLRAEGRDQAAKRARQVVLSAPAVRERLLGALSRSTVSPRTADAR